MLGGTPGVARSRVLTLLVVVLAACAPRTPASELKYDSGVYIADADETTSPRDAEPVAPDAIGEADADAGQPTPTWVDDVQPIIAMQCINCHGAVPVAGAPMPLVTYRDVTQMYRSTRSATDDFVYVFMATAVASPIAPMPPGSMLSADQVTTIARWAAAGAPERGVVTLPDAEPSDGDLDGGLADVASMSPDAAPVFPDADPVFPDAAPVFPDADPVFPDAAPVFPDAAPVFPDAGPPDSGVIDPLAGAGAVDLVQAGFTFLEGPLWIPGQDVLLFSDVGGGRIHRLTPPNTVAVFRDPSSLANGLALDPQGRLVVAEHDSRTITRSPSPGGVVVPLVTNYQGLAFNSPNDVTVRSDGVLYFTDPPYGLGVRVREIPFNGLFRVNFSTTATTVTAELQGPLASRPNGVVLSADETELFMADTAANTIARFSVAAGDGDLGAPVLFTTTAAAPDGMAIDVLGNLFVATSAGVEVYSAAGVRWGVIAVPQTPSNLAWGDADRRTLYITATDALYRVRLVNAGVRD